MIDFFKHILPPRFWKIVSAWGFIIAALQSVAQFTDWISEDTQKSLFIFSLILLLTISFLNFCADRYDNYQLMEKKDKEIKRIKENNQGLQEQMDSDQEEIKKIEIQLQQQLAYRQMILTYVPDGSITSLNKRLSIMQSLTEGKIKNE